MFLEVTTSMIPGPIFDAEDRNVNRNCQSDRGICATDGCRAPAVARKLCRGCYARWYKTSGAQVEIAGAKAPGWGWRGAHPLYDAWSYRMQWAKSDTVPEWHDFSAFVRDVGVRPPGTKLVRIDRSAPIGPGNFKWRENAPTNGARLARYRDGSKTFSGAQRDATLRRRFGITALEYDAMLASQGGRCAICDAAQADARKHPKTGKPIAFHVDHDHQAGEVRALLCGKCNVMLGSATESPRVLRRAAAYLETHRMRSVA